MVVSRRVRGSEKRKADEEDGGDKRGEYEESRAQRIKENMERMKSLGIAELSKQLKPPSSTSLIRKPKPKPVPSNDPPRRSTRLKELPSVAYSEKKRPISYIYTSEKKKSKKKKKGKKKKRLKSYSSEEVEILIPPDPEIYTEEHEKLLGDSVAAWTLYVDGFDEEGKRVYDSYQSKPCHQCRQNTIGLCTNCSKCNSASGQICGDCLYMRYGENVREVNLNQDWVCPACRGICNCSQCRRDKGWRPTGEIYSKVEKLGFKSVAHYLIRTRHEGAIVGVDDDDEKEGLSDVDPILGDEEHEDIVEPDSDSEYKGDDHDEEDDSSDSNWDTE